MISSAACGEIIRTYVKHGWILRRALLTAGLRKSLGESTSQLFGDVRVDDGDIDAAWFSRPPSKGEIAWEIRYLDETPFALLEYIDETNDNFVNRLSDVESRLIKTVAAKRNA